MFRTSLAAAVGAAAAALSLATASTAYAAPVTVLDLELNDPAGSSVAQDSSGFGHDATIGSHVEMNGSFAHFDRHPPGDTVTHPGHLIIAPEESDNSLDPERGTFTVEFRYRTTVDFGNILQKGQATASGGQVKVQQPKGKLSCMFKTPTGTSTVTSGARVFNDGQWHAVKCVRTATDVTLFVDGTQVGRNGNDTGYLNNTKPWSLGGKPECNATTITCDYFAGDVDYVRLTKG